MFSSGDRASWLNAVATIIMDGGASPPSIGYLFIAVPPTIVTRENDGHVTAAAALGEQARKDFQAGWRIIIEEMLTLLREQGYVGGGDQALTWIKPVDGSWRIAMPDGAQITVFGQRERRLSRDRAVVGERDEVDGSRTPGPPSSFETGRMHPLELDVIGPRGGREQMKFELHPFALAIPPMTEAERETLRASIARDGVKVPLVSYQKKILDGRHRAYFASVLHKPVEIKEFTGTEEAAKRHVAILNLHRRHLSTALQALVAHNLFGEESKIEARKAQIRGPSLGGKTGGRGRNSLPGKIRESYQDKHEREWQGIAAQKAKEVGLQTSPDAIKAMETVALAPQTKAAVERGEIKTISRAHKEALEELRQPATKLVQTADSLSINRRLGRMITEAQAILMDTDGEAPTGSLPEISGKLDQLEALVPKVRYTLRQRRIIS